MFLRWTIAAGVRPACPRLLVIVGMTLLGHHISAGPAQADPSAPQVGFPETAGFMPMAGTCAAQVEIYGVTDGIVDMDFNTVLACMSRSAPVDSDADCCREVNLNLEIEAETGFIPGVGDIIVELDGSQQPGHIESFTCNCDSPVDFPAYMTLALTKKFVTPIGTFYVDKAEMYGATINELPPIGVELLAPDPPHGSVALLDEEGVEVGRFYPTSVMPIYEIDPKDFPGGCGLAVPAVSEWGLVILCLLTLTVGTVVFSSTRRRSPTAV